MKTVHGISFVHEGQTVEAVCQCGGFNHKAENMDSFTRANDWRRYVLGKFSEHLGVKSADS